MKLLVTGFEPFGGEALNASEQAVLTLPKSIGGNEIVTAILPVSYTRSDKKLFEEIGRVSPDAVICVGQNAGSAAIRVETTAGNYAHSESEDNDHNLWLYRSVDMSGAPSYRSTLPTEEIVKNLQSAGIAAEVSHSAGTFVCNCLMYQMLRARETDFPNVTCGFIHVPCLPEQCGGAADRPCMELSTIVRGLKIAVGTVIDPAGNGIFPEEDQKTAATGATAAAADTVSGEATGAASAAEVVESAVDAVSAAEVAAEAADAVSAAEAAADIEPVIPVTAEPTEEKTDTETVSCESVQAAAEAVGGSAQAEPDSAEMAATAGTAEPETANAEKPVSAGAAAAAYFAKIRKEKEAAQAKRDEDSEIYYGHTSNRPLRKSAETESEGGDEAHREEILRRISSSVPEKIEKVGGEAPRETLYAPAQERYKVDTSDYRVFSVDTKYRDTAGPQEKMTLTQFMEEFVPERKKTEFELREEAERTLIKPETKKDGRSYAERDALRKAAAAKEAEKAHTYFGDVVVMSDMMRAMGKTLNKSVMVDGEIHMLLYTSLEENGNIIGYRIMDQGLHNYQNGRLLGELAMYAFEYEKYYIFRALTENIRFVIDPETFEMRWAEAK